MQYRVALILYLLCLSNSLHAEREAFTLPNGDRYAGDIVDGVLSGSGVYEWADGRRYDGAFVAGRRQGYGSLTWVNGDRYEGDFMANQRSGAGSMLWRNGQRYDGDFADDTMHGQGVYEWPDGRHFKGSFVGGQRTGMGIFVAADGTVFRGFFANDQRQGLVVKQLSNGDSFIERYGAGKLIESLPITADSRCQFNTPEGDWMVRADACINGLAHGSGNAVSLNGLALVEDGSWVLGKLVRGVVIALPTLMLDKASQALGNPPQSVSKALAND